MGVQIKTSGFNTVKLLIAACLLTGCVSTADTLSSVNTQPTPEPLQTNGTGATVQTASIQTENTGSEEVNYDPAQRAQAVAEIRAKSANASSGVPTNAFAQADGPNSPLSAEEQAAKITELESSATRNNASITDAELAAKQRSIKELQQKAKTHYNSAINNIKN